MNANTILKALQDAGIDGEMGHTGGGCGTIFVGPVDADGYAKVAIGPFQYRTGECADPKVYVGPERGDADGDGLDCATEAEVLCATRHYLAN
jgi:hypothetical protein